MLYVSIDIETSGLDPENNCILSFGAIIEDTKNKLSFDEIPKFYKIINQKNITGRPFAINMNKKIIEILAIYQEGEPTDEIKDMVIEEDMLAKDFFDFLYENGFYDFQPQVNQEMRMKNGRTYPSFGSKIKPIRFNVAGKNFGTFDKLFLEKVLWWQKLFKPRNKILDPGILFVDWNEDDQVPAMDLCKKRAGIEGIVTHDALDDAWDVIELLRKKY